MADPAPELLTERAFEQLLNAVPDAVFVTDGDGRILFANQQAEVLFGYSRPEMLGQGIETLIPERFRARHAPQRRAYVEAPRVRPMGLGLSLFGLRKNGEEFPVEISLSPTTWGADTAVISTVRDVSDRKAAAAALWAQEERFLRFVDAVKDYALILLDPEGSIVSWNAGAERLKGYRAEEIVGRSFARFFPPEEIAEDLPAAAIRRAALEGRFEHEGWRVRKDGSRFWANILLAALRDESGALQGFAEIARDMTAERHAEAAREQALAHEQAARAEAEAARQKLESLNRAFEPVAAAGVDLQAVLDATARAAAEAAGDGCELRLVSADGLWLERAAVYHTDPALSMLLRASAPRAEPVNGNLESSAFRTGQPLLIPLVNEQDYPALAAVEEVTAVEQFRVHSVLIVPLRTQTERIGTLTLWRSSAGRPYALEDITLLQELAARAALTIDNARLYHTAQAAVRTRDEFMSAISHDLGQPLTVVSGTLQLLQTLLARGTMPTPDELSEEVGAIASSTASMTAMVSELLDVAREQSGRPLELSYRPFDLVQLVERAVQMQRQTSELHQIEFHTAEASLPIEGDRDRLTRVFLNLLSNAVKYSPDGGPVTVTLAQEEAEQRRWAVLSVADGGLGIPAAELPRIFERFHRAGNVRHIPGTGIGLAGSKATVELHGGDIRVESHEGHGTTITIRLPLD